ncbi:wall-associated receptor kinase-like 6 [Miscanthus floridulus]|uniref:wall-associated receptor kinase-like 6 n=1 Tax=Miscanthus floridulus TaxID=154761 RepID=UPI003457C724
MSLQLLAAAALALAGPPVTLPGCRESCGEVSVPYPFGIGVGCFHEGFGLTCDDTQQPPKLLLLGDGVEVEVLDISLPDSTVRINSNVLFSASDSDSPEFNGTWSLPHASGPFVVSITFNWFVAVGCNIFAQLIPVGSEKNTSICGAMCVGNMLDDAMSACSGIGLCRTPIKGLSPSYSIKVLSVQRSTPTSRLLDTTHAAAFIVDREWYRIYGYDMPSNITSLDYWPQSVPAVLEWWFDLSRAQDLYLFSGLDDPRGNRCISSNSFAYYIDDANHTSQMQQLRLLHKRIRCNCSQGYEGNPYITHGCQDINECLQPKVTCRGTCVNVPGTYTCSPKKSIRSLPGLITVIAISGGFGLLFSLLGVTKVSKKLKQRSARKLKQKFFKRNHGLLLEQLISSNKDIAERTKVFSLEELEQATNKFDHNRILGGGGHGTVYKGILTDQRVVAIKRSKIVVQREIDQFINEVVILSQTNDRNVVKLFGCCLETEVPLLVFEFISNGTLSYHLHGQSKSSLPWRDRLRIALEIARAIAYLHCAASISVFHRDIKSANILLTDTLIAKVSDFGASRSISIDETGIHTAIQGTHGYLDPEYYYTSQLTDKSDVYSFGVILAELLTSVKPVFSTHSSEVKSLASHFVSVIKDYRLLDILDTQIVEEGGAKDAEVVARLAEACLSLKGEERPTMRQVETTLEDVLGSKVHSSSQVSRTIQIVLKDQTHNRSKGNEGTRLYSLEKEFIQSSEIPR